jgi:hypothetical protein
VAAPAPLPCYLLATSLLPPCCLLAASLRLSFVPSIAKHRVRHRVGPTRQGPVGDFRPGRPVEVPLWLAIMLKSRSQCTIRCPDWMTVGACAVWPGDERLPTSPQAGGS